MAALEPKYDTRITQEEQVIFEIHQLADEIFSQTQSSLEEISLSISQSQEDSSYRLKLDLDHEKQVKALTKRLKKQKIKDPYGKQYKSPYSQRDVQTSRPFYKLKQKQVNNVYQQLTERNKQKQQFEAVKAKAKINKQYKWVTSCYKKQKTIMDNLAVEHNIIRAEAKLLHQIKIQSRSLSNNQLQQRWNSFLEKEKTFVENKKMQLMQKNHEKIMEEKSRRNVVDPKPDRPKMTVENLIKKLKRDTLKLKEKLMQTTNYFKYKSPSKSVNKKKVPQPKISPQFKPGEKVKILASDSQFTQQLQYSAQQQNHFLIHHQSDQSNRSFQHQNQLRPRAQQLYDDFRQKKKKQSLKNGNNKNRAENRDRERERERERQRQSQREREEAKEKGNKNISLRSVQQITFLISSRHRARNYQQ